MVFWPKSYIRHLIRKVDVINTDNNQTKVFNILEDDILYYS